jgi:flagellar protein FlbD
VIWITRLNQKSVVLNSDLIEQIESTPDTVITLTTGEKVTVLESPEDLIERIRGFRRSLAAGPSERS